MTLYSGGVAQVDTTTNGILTAGAGAVQLTASGISLYTIQTATEAITGYPQYQLRWLNRSNPSQQVASILGEINVSDARLLRMFSYAPTSSQESSVRLYADSTTRAGINTPGITISNQGDLALRTVDIDGQDQVNLNGAVVNVSDNLDIAGDVSLDGIVTSQWKLQYNGGSKNFLVIDDTAASADTLLSLQNSGDDIGTGSNFILATKGATVQFQVRGDGRVNTVEHYAVDGTQVVSNRRTGWTAATNTKLRTTFDTTTVTTANLAARVGALIDDLIAHGIIGA